MRRIFLLLPLVALTGVAACNTVRGAGQDIQTGGAAVSESAREVQQDL